MCIKASTSEKYKYICYWRGKKVHFDHIMNVELFINLIHKYNETSFLSNVSCHCSANVLGLSKKSSNFNLSFSKDGGDAISGHLKNWNRDLFVRPH